MIRYFHPKKDSLHLGSQIICAILVHLLSKCKKKGNWNKFNINWSNIVKGLEGSDMGQDTFKIINGNKKETVWSGMWKQKKVFARQCLVELIKCAITVQNKQN